MPTTDLIVALDYSKSDRAFALLDELQGLPVIYKVGFELFMSGGPDLVRELVHRKCRVFLDLKFHDIPNTVSGAIAAATRLGVWMVNVHASGGRAMMQAARDAANEEAARRGKQMTDEHADRSRAE